MTNRVWETAIERAGVLTAPLALDELPDAELLRRFVAMREESAFAAIVRRHGALVWAVCRSLLPSDADAEDAYQATFLVLVRSAHKVRKPNALGAWLHTVARRVCRNSLRSRTRRQRHERAAAVSEAARPVAGATWDEWQSIAHEEIDRLPEAMRIAFVMCVMQGVRHADAAERLGWKIGTVSGRVCKAKQAVADALARRGLVGSAALAAALGGATTPLAAGLNSKGTAVAAQSSSLSPVIHELARAAMGGVMSKLKIVAVLMMVGALSIGVGTKVLSKAEAQTSSPPAKTAPGLPPGMGVGVGPNTTPIVAPEEGPARKPSGSPAGPPGSTGMPGMGGAGGGSSAAPKVEYKFVARPKGADAFKKLLIENGSQGWEYVGMVPGDDEVILKRLQRGGFTGFGSGVGPAGTSGFGMSGFGGGFSGGAGFGGGTGGFGPLSTLPGGTGLGGLPGAGTTTSGSGAGPMPPAAVIDLKIGETIRYRMVSGQQIDRVFSPESKVAEVSPDPTDAKRVLIKGIASGSAKLDLTDANGKKETFTIRVR
jgi:RNA polymerase sigma factor (sigma-70 family)